MRKFLSFMLLISACNVGFPQKPSRDPDFIVDNIEIFNDSKTLDSYDLSQQLDFIIRESAVFWQRSVDDLREYSIHIVDGDITCGIRTGPIGCTNPIDKVIEISSNNYICPASLAIPHEMGHAFYLDPMHTNPKFRDMESLYWDITSKNQYFDWDRCLWQHYDGINHYPFKDWNANVGY